MKYTFFCLILFLALVNSCKKDTEMTFPSTETVSVEGNKSIHVIKDSVLFYDTHKINYPFTKIANNNNKEESKRFITSNNQGDLWVKAKFSGLREFGLDNNIYYIREECFYQYIPPKTPQEIAVPYTLPNTKMGFTRYTNSSYDIGFSHSSGNYIINDCKVNCRTILLHIGYDSNGKVIDRYVPCSPSELTWNYSWLSINKNKS